MGIVAVAVMSKKLYAWFSISYWRGVFSIVFVTDDAACPKARKEEVTENGGKTTIKTVL